MEGKTMIISLKKGTTQEQLDELVGKIEADGLEAKVIPGETKTVVNVIGDTAEKSTEPYESLPYVDQVFRITERRYAGVTKEHLGQKTIVKVGDISIGSDLLTIMGGPCALEGPEQIRDSVELARDVRDNHQDENIEGYVMRGGAYKPRTSPDSFQGQKKEGLIHFSQLAHEYGLPIITEVMDPRDVEFVAEYADILQIGTRNAQNFPLLTEVGKSSKPVLLKRGFGNSIDEFLGASNYIAREGNQNIILCLRGTVPMKGSVYRFQPDIADIVYLRERVSTPIAFDPSHSSGDRDLVIPLSKLAVTAGADALLVDIHPYPEIALMDADQQLPPKMADQFMQVVNLYKGVYRQEQRLLTELQSQNGSGK